MALLCDLSSVNRFAGSACVIYPDHDHNASLSAFMWTVPCPVWLQMVAWQEDPCVHVDGCLSWGTDE